MLKKGWLGFVFDLVEQSLTSLTARLRRRIDQEIWYSVTRSAAYRARKRRLAPCARVCFADARLYESSKRRKAVFLAAGKSGVEARVARLC
jgi:hypothetical protein